MRAFGVGCFHFGYRKNIPFEFKASDFVKELEERLGLVKSIGDLSVSWDDISDYTIIIEDKQPLLSDGGMFPSIEFLEVEFSVFIPARIQDSIFPGEKISTRTTTENFRVSIRNAFHGPVSFVECLNAKQDCDPSDAVRLIRVYMKQEFSKSNSSVTFESLGPSPFHADFFVKAGNTDGNGMRIEELAQRGYNRITLFHESSSQIEDIFEFIKDELCHELDLFYDIQSRAVKAMRKGGGLIEKWSQLQMTSQRMPAIWKIRARLKLHRAARDLVLDALALQAEFAVAERQIARDVDQTYRKGTAIYMEKYVRENAESFPTYPLDAILAWARHIEEGSFKQAEIIAVVLSAIGGGIVGALATLFASSGS